MMEFGSCLVSPKLLRNDFFMGACLGQQWLTHDASIHTIYNNFPTNHSSFEYNNYSTTLIYNSVYLKLGVII